MRVGMPTPSSALLTSESPVLSKQLHPSCAEAPGCKTLFRNLLPGLVWSVGVASTQQVAGTASGRELAGGLEEEERCEYKPLCFTHNVFKDTAKNSQNILYNIGGPQRTGSVA